MKLITIAHMLVSVSISIGLSQSSYLIHQRGMLHQTVYNAGDLGRLLDNGALGAMEGVPSFEWPANGTVTLKGIRYEQYNSLGGGLYIAANVRGVAARQFVMCGGGQNDPPEGKYSYSISQQRIENYPVLPNGNLNPAYNPNEAEEIIVAKWATPLGITVTRTSRAWSFPDYDDFIIYEYELENTGDHSLAGMADTLSEMLVGWGQVLGSSMFGYQRVYNKWSDADYRDKDQIPRFDLNRYMIYTHDRNGKPDPEYFDAWSRIGQYGGGLNSPGAIGMVMLYYDYTHLADSANTRAVTGTTSSSIWDLNKKMKQPYLNRIENGNLTWAKVGPFFDCTSQRKTGPFSSNDSATFGGYWVGRAKPNWMNGLHLGTGRILGYGPYILPPGQKMRFVVAEVAGFGPGVASDSIYTDLGGGVGTTAGPIVEPTSGVGYGRHPIPSWYNKLVYPFVAEPASAEQSIGSDYLQHYPLPSYVSSNVISIRDVADRAIQAYTGWPLIKYDSVQYEPLNAPPAGVYRVTIPLPAPCIHVDNTIAAVNRISWGPQIESFATPRLNAQFSYYKVMKSPHPLGPCTLIDSVGRRDPRYFQDSLYVIYDRTSKLGEAYYYTVVSVDALGGQSGTTNLTLHATNAPAVSSVSKVYVVPNPLILTAGYQGQGNIDDRIGFYGLPNKATIRIFSYSGQLITTIEHDSDSFVNVTFVQVTRNNQLTASGVYYFTVDDPSGKRVWGKFVIIK